MDRRAFFKTAIGAAGMGLLVKVGLMKADPPVTFHSGFWDATVRPQTNARIVNIEASDIFCDAGDGRLAVYDPYAMELKGYIDK